MPKEYEEDEDQPEEKGFFSRMKEGASKMTGGASKFADKYLIGSVVFTGLAALVYTPLAMLGGALSGGYASYKNSSQYDSDPPTMKDTLRNVVSTVVGSFAGMFIVTACAMLGSLLGPVGALAGAAIGAAITYKASPMISKKFVTHPEKTPEQSAISRPRSSERAIGRDRSRERDKATVFPNVTPPRSSVPGRKEYRGK